MPTAKPKMAKNKDPNERRAVFVDENACIGCKCVGGAGCCLRCFAVMAVGPMQLVQWTIDANESRLPNGGDYSTARSYLCHII